METVKLGHFDEYQKTYVIACIATEQSIKASIKNFQEVFPDFGAGLDKNTLEYKLARRISDIKRKNALEIEAYREFALHSELHQVAYIPIIYAEVRQHYLQRMFDETPDRSLKGVSKDENGKETRIYKSHTLEKLLILRKIRKEQKSSVLPLRETLEHLMDGLSVVRSGGEDTRID